jgi:hypothetical protein
MGSPVDVTLAAYATLVNQLDDVAGTLIDPLVMPQDAGPLALQLGSTFVEGDPALPEDARAPRARSLRDRALGRDPRLWRARLVDPYVYIMTGDPNAPTRNISFTQSGPTKPSCPADGG